MTCSGLNLDPFRFTEWKFPAVRSDGTNWRPFQVLLMDAKPEIHISIFSFTDTNTQINYLGGSSYRWYVWFYKWIRLISLCVCVLVAQSCQILCHPMNCSPPGFSVHGFLQARTLEWFAIPFSRGSSQPRDWTLVSCIAGRFFTIWATGENEIYLGCLWLVIFRRTSQNTCVYTLLFPIAIVALVYILSLCVLSWFRKRNLAPQSFRQFTLQRMQLGFIISCEKCFNRVNKRPSLQCICLISLDV